MKFDWKKILPHVVALTLFIGFALAYCSPTFEGKELQAGDVNNWKGTANEALEYREQTGDVTWWTNSQFCGMPTFQIAGKQTSSDIVSWWKRGTQDVFGEPIAALILYFIGFYLMLLCFGVNPWLSIVGSFAIGLSSYFFLIIPAGHMSKAFALGALAPVIGGLYSLFRKKYWLAIPVILIFAPYGIMLHPQMTYYIGMLMGLMLIAEIITYCVKREWKSLAINLPVIIACVGLIYGARYVSMRMNQDYLKETMRGGHSELTHEGGNEVAKGLDLKYATDWSYGIDETLTLMVPNMMGGASGYELGEHSSLYKDLSEKLTKDYQAQGVPKRQAEKYAQKSAKDFCKSAPTYWGDKMFTSGAVYVGAIVCFLFLLGCIIVPPNPYTWVLIAATLFSIFLAWGRHYMGLTEFFFNYFPMYNRFRTVESILVVAEITMPLLGFLGLQRIMEGKVSWKRIRVGLFVAGGVTALICLVMALFGGSIFSFESTYDQQWIGQVGDDIYQMIIDQRKAMMTSDAWRSLIFILLGFGLVYAYAWFRRSFGNKKKYNIIFIIGLAAIILLDMIPVNRRFFGDKDFVKTKDAEAYFKIQPWEKEILDEQGPDDRVFNMASNTFNDARTSYRLKSIGGYSAVKLRRYQDLIDEHISKMNWSVINMLNTKFIVHPEYGVVPNPDAYGNAWFVDNVQFVPTPDDESAALNTLDLRHTAVADEKFRDVLTCDAQPNEADEIVLTDYKPNELTYTCNCANDRVAVFSEIYYPEGWHLYVDGEEVQIGRVNYVLRAAVIPAGEHIITMHFMPGILRMEWLSILFAILTLVISVACLTWPLWNKYCKKNKELLS